jgi:hypothetical protein
MAIVWHLGAGYTSGVDYNTNAQASGTSINVNKPTGLADGMTLRAYFYSQASAGSAATAPSGWTLEVAPTSRRGGIYRKHIPSASAETATSYTWSTGGSGRNMVIIWLSEGESTASPVDVAGAFVTEATSVNAASVTASESDSFLATFMYWNNSSTTVTTANFPGSMTKLLDVNSPTTGNTSGVAIATEQLSASGATGTRAVSGTPTPVNMSAVSIAYRAAVTSPTRTATGGVTLGGTADGVEGGAVRTATGGVTISGEATGFEVEPYPPQPFSIPQMDAWIAKGYPVHWAHRGGSANWSEMTMYAYDNAVDAGARCLEVSVHRSSDGVWIMSHDSTLTRVTAETYTISSTSSSTLLGIPVDTPGSGGVIGRLEDLLTAYPDRVLLVDNKPGSFFDDFLDLLETVPDCYNQIIVKLDGQFGSLANFQAAQARGFKTCGYWYPNNYAANLPAKAPYCDYIGMQYDASESEWDDIFAYGKPVWGHVIQNSTQYNLCVAAGCDIFQLADVEGLMPPWNVAYATDGTTMSGDATAVSGYERTATGGVTLGGSVATEEREVTTGSAGVTLGGSVVAFASYIRTASAGVTISGTATGIGSRHGNFSASMTLGPAAATGDRPSEGGFSAAITYGPATSVGDRSSDGGFGAATVWGAATASGESQPEGVFGAAVVFGPANFGADSDASGAFSGTITFGPAGATGSADSKGTFTAGLSFGPAAATGDRASEAAFGADMAWGPATAGSSAGTSGSFGGATVWGPATATGSRPGEGVFTAATLWGPALASGVADRSGGFGAAIEWGPAEAQCSAPSGAGFVAGPFAWGPARFRGLPDTDFAALGTLGLTVSAPRYELTVTTRSLETTP